MLSLASPRAAAKRRLSIILNGLNISTHDRHSLKICVRNHERADQDTPILSARPCSGPFFVETKPKEKR